jgi:hypothetical protein
MPRTVASNDCPRSGRSVTPMASTCPAAVDTSTPGIPTSPYSGASSAARSDSSISSWSVITTPSSSMSLACSRMSSTGSLASYDPSEWTCGSIASTGRSSLIPPPYSVHR